MLEIIKSQRELAKRYKVTYRDTARWLAEGLPYIPAGGERKQFCTELVDKHLALMFVQKASPDVAAELAKFKTRKKK